MRNAEGPEEAAEAVSRPDGPGIRLKSIDPTHMAPVEHVQGAGLRAAGQLLGELEALRFASREAPTGLADDEVADPERDRGVARAPHGVDVTPLLEELGDALGLDVSERAVALDQTGNLAAIAGAAARVTGAALRADATTTATRLIAVTRYGEAEDVQRARRAGFDDHLTKPVDPDVLLGRLDPKPDDWSKAHCAMDMTLREEQAI